MKRHNIGHYGPQVEAWLLSMVAKAKRDPLYNTPIPYRIPDGQGIGPDDKDEEPFPHPKEVEENVLEYVDVLRQAMFFWIHNRELIRDTDYTGFKFAEATRLPYENMAVEYDVPDDVITQDGVKFTRRLMQVYEVTDVDLKPKSERMGFAIRMFFGNSSNHWADVGLDFELAYDVLNEALEELNQPETNSRDLPFSYVYHGIMDDDTTRKAEQAILNDVEFLVKFLAILQIRPLEIEDIEPSEKLNKKRDKTGKPRIPTYKLLRLPPPPKPSKKKEGKGGTHASPVTHYRRGHIRRLRKDTPKELAVWVPPTIVNPGGPASYLYYV